jgi:hypothetical protein
MVLRQGSDEFRAPFAPFRAALGGWLTWFRALAFVVPSALVLGFRRWGRQPFEGVDYVVNRHSVHLGTPDVAGVHDPSSNPFQRGGVEALDS